MKMRSRLSAAAILVALSPAAAFAADMPGSYAPPTVIYAPPADEDVADCGGRGYDKVWQAPQVAYILAGSCGPASWHGILGHSSRERILVYYNGGSRHRTDITSITRPVRPPKKH